MAGAAGGLLAGAVSASGGLGMIGVGAAADREWISREVALARASGRPWGAGFMAWALERDIEPLRILLEHERALVALSFGDVSGAARLVKDAGVTTAMQIGNADELERALADDIDIVVVRGSEGGGHGRGEVATLPLLQLALDRTDKPIIAAGGIATARGVAAVLAAGASAAWVGTRFAASAESLSADTLKQRITEAGLGDTVYTRAFDIAQRLPWPAEFGGRALRNRFTDDWADRTDELADQVQADDRLTTEMATARAQGDTIMAPVYAGESAALTNRIESAADIVADLAHFREHLDAARTRWG